MKFSAWSISRLAKEAGVDIEGLDKVQLAHGMKVEREHDGSKGRDTRVAKGPEDILKIAVAHLRERPDYYTLLKKSGL